MKASPKFLALGLLPLSTLALASPPQLYKAAAAPLIQQKLNAESGECILARGNPVAHVEAISISQEIDTPDSPASRILNALTKVGFLQKSTGVDIDIRGVHSPGAIFTLTPKGKQYLSEASDPGLYYFCSGRYKVTGVKNINQGTDQDGQDYIVVEYTYRIVNAADWMKSQVIQQSEPDRDLHKKLTSSQNIAHASLESKPEGWEVTSTFDLHDE